MNETSNLRTASFVLAVAASLLGVTFSVAAKDIYVSVTGSDTNSGASAAAALRTMASASEKAYPGDTVWILPGDYSEPIKPVRSGKAGSPITYRASDLGRRPVIRSGTGIVIDNLSYIVIDGIAVNGGRRAPDAAVNIFADVFGANYAVIRNGDFRYTNGGHGIRIRSSSYVTVEDNTIDFVGEFKDATGRATGDAIGVDEGSSRVLIKGNDLRHGGHNLITMNGRESVIRDNFMDNSWRDVYGGEAGYRSASIKGRLNVFEHNYIARNGVGSYYASNVLAKIQGEYNVARHNIFANAIDQALESDSGDSSPISWKARIYHNTFYNLNSAAWRVRFYPAGNGSVGQNAFLNNLVQRSRLKPASGSQDTDVMFVVSEAGAGATAGSKVMGNIFSPAASVAPMVLLDGFEGRIDLYAAEKAYPALFVRNSAQKVVFTVDSPVKAEDFKLAKGSAGIDAGLFLTRVEANGSGTKVPVADTYLFSDGWGLVKGDAVQLQGTTVRATVVRIDHVGRTLELDRSLDFQAGQGIALAYEGSAPDVGAYEFANYASLPPMPPSSVTVE